MARGESGREANGGKSRLSRAGVQRLSLYLRRLEGLFREGSVTISSSQLGGSLGVTDAQVRRDLTSIGSLGHSGIGYPTRDLIDAIRRTLGIDHDWKLVIVGVGNLARALLRYRGFQEQGFRIVALVDADAAKVGQTVDGLTISSADQLETVVATTGAELGVVTVPAPAAQGVADALVNAGIRGILNFAPTLLRLPKGISLVSVDLTVPLEQLTYLVGGRRFG